VTDSFRHAFLSDTFSIEFHFIKSFLDIIEALLQTEVVIYHEYEHKMVYLQTEKLTYVEHEHKMV